MPTVKMTWEQENRIAVEAAMSELFSISNYKRFEFDARFTRFIEWMFNACPEEIIPLIKRLMGRTKLDIERNSIILDPLSLSEAIQKEPGDAYDSLVESGLL